jgi:hypothetical protein
LSIGTCSASQATIVLYISREYNIYIGADSENLIGHAQSAGYQRVCMLVHRFLRDYTLDTVSKHTRKDIVRNNISVMRRLTSISYLECHYYYLEYEKPRYQTTQVGIIRLSRCYYSCPASIITTCSCGCNYYGVDGPELQYKFL